MLPELHGGPTYVSKRCYLDSDRGHIQARSGQDIVPEADNLSVKAQQRLQVRLNRLERF
jgi:hypothetical protein